MNIDEQIEDIAYQIDNQGFMCWLEDYANTDDMPTEELKTQLTEILSKYSEIQPLLDEFKSNFEI